MIYYDHVTGGYTDENGSPVDEATVAHHTEIAQRAKDANPMQAGVHGAGSRWRNLEQFFNMPDERSEDEKLMTEYMEVYHPTAFSVGEFGQDLVGPSKGGLVGRVLGSIGLSGLYSDEGERTAGMITGGVGSLVGEGLTKGGAKLLKARNYRQNNQQELLEGAQMWGDTSRPGAPAPDLTPSQKYGGALEDFDEGLRSMPGAGQKMRVFEDKQKQHIKNLTLTALGLDPEKYGRVSQTALKAVDDEYRRVVTPIFDSIDQQPITGALKEKLERKILKSADTRGLLEDISGFKYEKAKFGPDGEMISDSVLEMDGKAMKKVRQKLNKWSAGSDDILGEHATGARDALDDVIEGNVGPEAAAAYRLQRQRQNLKININKGAALNRSGDVNPASVWTRLKGKDINEDVANLQQAIESTGFTEMEGVVGKSPTYAKKWGASPKQWAMSPIYSKVADQYLLGNMSPLGLLEPVTGMGPALGSNLGRAGGLLAQPE